MDRKQKLTHYMMLKACEIRKRISVDYVTVPVPVNLMEIKFNAYPQEELNQAIDLSRLDLVMSKDVAEAYLTLNDFLENLDVILERIRFDFERIDNAPVKLISELKRELNYKLNSLKSATRDFKNGNEEGAELMAKIAKEIL